jgi:glycosyltransferase involved in cell wall biosynthesis
MGLSSRPRVSVLVAAHDAAPYLPRALGSALGQSLADLEVVVVDDASRDATAEVVAEVARHDPRVRLIRSPRNLGPAGARNLGLEAACGRWVALLDADDAYQPRRLERLLDLARERGADMVADNLLLVPAASGERCEVMLPTSLLDQPRRIDAATFLLGNLPLRGHPRVSYGFLKPVLRREFLAGHGLCYRPELRFAEDFDLYLRCLLAGARFWLIPEAGYLYTISAASLTGRHHAGDLLRLRAVDRRLLRRPEVAADPRLHDALARHARSIDRRLLWRLFTDAIKAGELRRAVSALATPYRAALVIPELLRALPGLAAKALRPTPLRRRRLS